MTQDNSNNKNTWNSVYMNEEEEEEDKVKVYETISYLWEEEKNITEKEEEEEEEDNDEKKIINEEEEDIFDRFSDSSRKRKRIEKKIEKTVEKRRKIVDGNKTYAEDCFNDNLTDEEYNILIKYINLAKILKKDELNKLLKESTIEDIKFEKPNKSNGLACIINFFKAYEHCKQWLDDKIILLGWKKNMTEYDPLEVSFSTQELLSATIECYKMAIKQMIKVLDYQTK